MPLLSCQDRLHLGYNDYFVTDVPDVDFCNSEHHARPGIVPMQRSLNRHGSGLAEFLGRPESNARAKGNESTGLHSSRRWVTHRSCPVLIFHFRSGPSASTVLANCCSSLSLQVLGNALDSIVVRKLSDRPCSAIALGQCSCSASARAYFAHLQWL